MPVVCEPFCLGFAFRFPPLKILAKATAILLSIAVPCVCKQFRLLNGNEFSCKISLKAFPCKLPCKRLGMGGVLL